MKLQFTHHLKNRTLAEQLAREATCEEEFHELLEIYPDHIKEDITKNSYVIENTTPLMVALDKRITDFSDIS